MATILLIEDEPQIRWLYKTFLEGDGHDIIEADNGDVGLKLYRQSPTDLVITDIIMPEKEGIETIMELRRDFPLAKIIAISGGGKTTTTDTCLHLAGGVGATATLAKPVGRDELLDAVRNILASG